MASRADFWHEGLNVAQHDEIVFPLTRTQEFFPRLTPAHRKEIRSVVLRLPRLLRPVNAEDIIVFAQATPNPPDDETVQNTLRLFEETVLTQVAFERQLSSAGHQLQLLSELGYLLNLESISIETPDYWPADIYEDYAFKDEEPLRTLALRTASYFLNLVTALLPNKPDLKLCLLYTDSTFFTSTIFTAPAQLQRFAYLSHLEIDFTKRDDDLRTLESDYDIGLANANTFLGHCAGLETLVLASRNRKPDTSGDEGLSCLDFAALTCGLRFPRLTDLTIVRFDAACELYELLLDHSMSLQVVRLFGVRLNCANSPEHVLGNDMDPCEGFKNVLDHAEEHHDHVTCSEYKDWFKRGLLRTKFHYRLDEE